MQHIRFAVVLIAASLALPALAAPFSPGQGQAIVTLLPKDNGAAAPSIQPQNLQLKIGGKDSSITSLAPAKGPNSPLELIFLIDDSARASLGTEFGEIGDFVKEMPADAKIAIAYMENGRAALTGPLSSNPPQILAGLHVPIGTPGTNGSPYFCLSDLAKNWPSHDPTARREVVMITDGVDDYNRRYDPDDPYVQAAIDDSLRSGLVVYSIYWVNRGRLDQTMSANNAGQNLLAEVTQATGGINYWEGIGDPVTFDPYLKDLRRRFQNQYRVTFSSELKGKPELAKFSLKLQGAEAKITAPQQVFITRGSTAGGE